MTAETKGGPAPSPERGMRDGLPLYTIEDLEAWGACYDREDLEELARGTAKFTVLDVLRAAHLQHSDRLWVVLRPEIIPLPGLLCLGADFVQHAASEAAATIEVLSPVLYHSAALLAARAVVTPLSQADTERLIRAILDEEQRYSQIADRCFKVKKVRGGNLCDSHQTWGFRYSLARLMFKLARAAYFLVNAKKNESGTAVLHVARAAAGSVGELGVFGPRKTVFAEREHKWQVEYLIESLELHKALSRLQPGSEEFRTTGEELMRKMAAGFEADAGDLSSRITESVEENSSDKGEDNG